MAPVNADRRERCFFMLWFHIRLATNKEIIIPILSLICPQQQSGEHGLIRSFVTYNYLSKYLFDIYNPMSDTSSRSPAIAMRESRPGSVSNQMLHSCTNMAYHLPRQDFTHILFLLFFPSQDSQMMTLIVLHICFSIKVTFNGTSISELLCLWSHHCGILTAEKFSVCWMILSISTMCLCQFVLVCGLPQF